jgi:hypothetical protein
MNPAIIQAAAAERTRERHAYAAARRHAAEIRRARRAQRPQPAPRTGRGFRVLRVLRTA